LSVVSYLCERIAVMYLGRIVEVGPTTDVELRPLHPYTRALLGSIPRPDPRERRLLSAPLGEIPNAVDRPTGPLSPALPAGHAGVSERVSTTELKAPGHWVACHAVPVALIDGE
jgi:oligopeptide/dipeptide ABC transporter ATP-binding protein